MLYKIVLAFEAVDEILKCDHSRGGNTLVYCGSVYCVVKALTLAFENCKLKRKVYP